MIILITIDGRDAEEVAEEVTQNLEDLRDTGSYVFAWSSEQIEIHTHVNPSPRPTCPWRH